MGLNGEIQREDAGLNGEITYVASNCCLVMGAQYSRHDCGVWGFTFQSKVLHGNSRRCVEIGMLILQKTNPLFPVIVAYGFISLASWQMIYGEVSELC